MIVIISKEVEMKLRKLEQKDAPFMLEWMHDKSIAENMAADFMGKTMEDCEAFIASAAENRDSLHMTAEYRDSLHMAVVDEADEYMGTVSLKWVKDGQAEFAIVLRKTAMGKGFARYAMEEMLRYGLEEKKLSCIYWCVSPANRRAVRFYEKNGYKRVSPVHLKIGGGYSEYQIHSYIWYMETAEERRKSTS